MAAEGEGLTGPALSIRGGCQVVEVSVTEVTDGTSSFRVWLMRARLRLLFFSLKERF